MGSCRALLISRALVKPWSCMCSLNIWLTSVNKFGRINTMTYTHDANKRNPPKNNWMIRYDHEQDRTWSYGNILDCGDVRSTHAPSFLLHMRPCVDQCFCIIYGATYCSCTPCPPPRPRPLHLHTVGSTLHAIYAPPRWTLSTRIRSQAISTQNVPSRRSFTVEGFQVHCEQSTPSLLQHRLTAPS